MPALSVVEGTAATHPRTCRVALQCALSVAQPLMAVLVANMRLSLQGRNNGGQRTRQSFTRFAEAAEDSNAS
jgi:hypothetical protein